MVLALLFVSRTSFFPSLWHVRHKFRARASASSFRPKCTGAQASSRHQASSKRVSRTTRSPSDLIAFRRSRYVAYHNELLYRGLPHPERDGPDRLQSALATAGLLHESRVLNSLFASMKQLNSSVTRLDLGPSASVSDTLRAIHAGTSFIAQAPLRTSPFQGRADALVRADNFPLLPASARNAAHNLEYVVVEVKLASVATAEGAMQAAMYAEMLRGMLQLEKLPRVWIFTGSTQGRSLDARALGYLLKETRKEYMQFLKSFDSTEKIPSAPPVDAHPDALSPWKSAAQNALDSADSLLNVAGIRRKQMEFIRRELGVCTLREFAELEESRVRNAARSKRVAADALARLRRQAALQRESEKRGDGSVAFEILEESEVQSGQIHPLARVPPSSAQDWYFDIEGYPLYERQGGLEYLLGATRQQGEGKEEFAFWWAHDRTQEERAFIALVEMLWKDFEETNESAKMHVYHYGHYEVAALRRIAARAVTVQGREAGRLLEHMLGAGVFVDIYNVVRQGLIVGERSYSIKKIEKVLGISRLDHDLADAASSVAMYHQWRAECGIDIEGEKNSESELPPAAQHELEHEHDHALLQEILLYNRQDCESLSKVVSWLRDQAQSKGIAYSAPMNALSFEDTSVAETKNESESEDAASQSISSQPREACGRSPEDKASDGETILRADELCSFLMDRKPFDNANPTLKTLLAGLLQFHVRENGPVRHRFADRVSRSVEGDTEFLYSDTECIASVVLKRFDQGKRCFLYSFDRSQHSAIVKGSGVAVVAPAARISAMGSVNGMHNPSIFAFASVKELDLDNGSVYLRISGKGAAAETDMPKCADLVRTDELILCPSALRQSILDTTERLLQASENCVQRNTHSETRTTLSDKLIRNFLNREPVHTRAGDMTKETVMELLPKLQGQTLVIQGPPGSGKTTYSAELIRSLIIDHGMTVAVSSNSHAAIDNLLERVIQLGVEPNAVCKIGPRSEALLETQQCSSPSKLRVAPALFAEKPEPKSEGESDRISDPSSPGPGRRRSRSKRKEPVCLVGATAYALSRLACDASSSSSSIPFDILFVDEAGQVPMANFIAMAPCAKGAVLVGDHQQLEMPLQGSHPPQVQKSCLTHIVGDDVSIVSSHHGLFLDTSFRMEPSLCDFVSTTFYNGALHSHASCVGNKVHLPVAHKTAPLAEGRGVVFISSDSEGISNGPENLIGDNAKWNLAEAQVVHRLFHQLLGAKCTVKGKERALGLPDILVVATFNAQVVALRRKLPEGARIGTVDKFQGQEAPVVIVSSCASPVDRDLDLSSGNCFSEPRGAISSSLRSLQFAVNPNRLNVAISRASCLAVVVGHKHACANAPTQTLQSALQYGLYQSLTEYS